VKGRSGARYKQSMSPAEEESTLRGWGFTPDDV